MSNQNKNIQYDLPKTEEQKNIPTEYVKASELFDMDLGPVELLLERPQEKGVRVPSKINPFYHFDKELLKVVLMALYGFNRNIRIFGSTSTGKSTIIEEVMARLNINVYRFDGHPDSDFDEIVGTVRSTANGFQYRDGTFTQFWTAEEEFAVFLFEEMDYNPAGVIASLNPALDGRPLEIPSNPDAGIIPRNHFGPIFSTGNTVSGHDENGNMPGVMEQNSAAIRRWTAKRAHYMTAEAETKVLRSTYPEIDENVIKVLIDYANATRAAHEIESDNGPKLYTPMSTGEVIMAVNDYGKMGSLHLSVAMNYGNKLPSDTDRALSQSIWDRIVSNEHSIFERSKYDENDLNKAA